MPPVRPVVLSGGSGTRLWPLSTPEVPKQFSPLFGDRSLFGMTLERMAGVAELQPTIVVTGHMHESLVVEATRSSPIETGTILIEPVGRNTAPAAIAAALVAVPHDVLVILPSDHLITDASGFRDAISTAADLADAGSIVTFGINPTRPETGFGYIELGPKRGPVYDVARFKEKPSAAEAAELAGDGRHLWNSGIFVVRADQLLSDARELCPAIVDGVERALPAPSDSRIRLGEGFSAVESISFDHAIMERTDHALVVPIDVGWSDVGSYRSLLEESDRDGSGNHLEGAVTVSDVRGSYIKSTSRPVVVAGLDGVVVVETPEAVLVVSIDHAQRVKDLRARVDGE